MSFSGAPKSSRLRRFPIVAGIAAATMVASLAYYYLSEPLSQWLNTSSQQPDSSLDTAGISAATKRSGKRKKVALIISETFANQNLLSPSTQEVVDLLIIYPTNLSAVLSLPSVEELQRAYVAHPTHVFSVSKLESVKPILRHIALDGKDPITIVVADGNVDLFKDDENIAKYVGDVVAITGSPEAAEKQWRQSIVGLS
ncbi:uncharacterized protein V1513DRAFT_463738 [Lipomyces chichibuensis]|uniref:uncharacterized protein n=1 Tax=Lipomyces chichibuensis TaxID=1546026 RepID=UPI0033436583